MTNVRVSLAVAACFASGLAFAQAPAAGTSAPSAAQPAAKAPAAGGKPAPGAPAAKSSAATPSGTAKGDKAQARAKDGERKRDPNLPKGGRQLQGLYAGVMTDDEQNAYRDKVRNVKTYAECKTLLEATHKTMEPRAKAQGKTIAQSPVEACDAAKARGRVTG
jgi:hypothetical protein